MGYSAKIVLDSVSTDGVRLTTMELTLPRLSLPELNTHRALSKNSASSRAIPVNKRIIMCLEDPYVPTQFGSNKKGMSSGEPLEGVAAEKARDSWLRARDAAVVEARVLADLGVHKEYANRVLEPFCWHTALLTGTELDNFWNLRCHPAASEPIRTAVEMLRDAFRASAPRPIDYGQWHLPFMPESEVFDLEVAGKHEDAIKRSIGRCARVSYLTHEGEFSPEEDIRLFNNILGNHHMSPLEHAARPAAEDDGYMGMTRGDVYRGRADLGAPSPADTWFGNFRGWVQFRKTIPGEAVFRG